ncbi:copia-type polyprotein, partial [Rhodotorula toruloides]
MVSKLPDNIAGQLLDLDARGIWLHLTNRFDLGNKESIQSILAAIRSLKARVLRPSAPSSTNMKRSFPVLAKSTLPCGIVGRPPSKRQWQVVLLTAAATIGKGTSSASPSGKKQPQQQRPKCKICQEENPRHSVERCWQNPENPNNRLKEGGDGKGKGKEKEKKSKKDDKKDKDGKVVTLAIATVASLVDGVHDGSKAPTDWHLDTCASRHIVAERRYFISYRQTTTPIVTASGPSLEGIGVGTAEIEVITSSGRFKLQLKDAIHVPTSSFNLISAPRFINAGYKLDGQVLAPEVTIVSPTIALLATPQEERVQAVGITHRRYGHPSKAAMRDLLRLGEVKGFTTTDLDVFFSKSCPPCQTGKLTKSSFPIIERQATLPLQRLHSDLAGKFPFTSFGGAQYFIIVRDEASGYIDGEPLKDKTEALDAFKRIFFRMKAEFESSKVDVAGSTTLQTDNGSEYTSRAFRAFLAGEGITHRLSIPYTPQQNGLSERAVRTVKEKITTLLAEANLSKKYWAEVFFFALFIINNLPYSPNGGETPYHYLHHTRNPFFGDKTPILGQDIWIHDPDAGTFDDKSYKGIFLGVGQHRGVKGYRVQSEDDRGTNRMIWSRNISFAPGDYVPRTSDVDDEDFAWIEEEVAEEGGAGMTPIEEQQQEELEEPAPMEEPAQLPKPGARERRGKAAAEEEEEEDGLRRGSRVRKQATFHQYGHTPAGVAVALVNVAVEPSDIEDTQFAILNIPQPALATKKAFSIVGRPVPKQPPSTKEALSSIYSTEWKEGMNEEWAGFQQQDVVGDLIPREPDMKVLGTRWHHTARVDPKAETAQLKSRLVVQGVKTIPFLSSFGPTFTPLPRWDVISLFFVLATRLKLPVYVTDFAKAYLSAQVATGGDTVFIKQPPGFEVPGREDHEYQLKRAAYGLPQSGRAFHLKVKDKLDQLDFVSLSEGVTLYIGRRGGDYVILVIYVDDGLIAGKKALVEDVVGELQEDFDVTFGGTVDGKSFLGRDISHDPQTGSILVSVKSQIEKALKMHGFENIKPLHMPIQPGVVYVEWDGEAIKPSEYLSAVGSLLFIATTRVDVQYAVGVASRYSSNPGPKHWELVKRIFAYLSVTRDVALEMGLSRSDGSGLVAFVDADHGGDIETRRSTTGVVVQLDGTTILTLSLESPWASLYAVNTPDAKILGCRFVYRRKKDEHGRVTGHKVRLVAQGFSQRPGVDFRDTFAPVAKFTSIRVLLALAARKKMLIHQADVDKAYLHGSLDEELYMRIPEGIDSGEYSGKVLKLDRALYGLKQAGRVWNHRIDRTLRRLGYRRTVSDACIYSRRAGGVHHYIALYVDDLLFVSPSLGEITRIHQRSDGSLFLSQRAYLEDVLLRLDPNGRRTAPTPMVPNQQLVPAPMTTSPLPTSAVGTSKPWAPSCTPCSGLASISPTLSASSVYIRGTLDYGLEYTPDSSPLRGFEAYSDPDWGACPTTSRSTMGYVFLLANGAVSWSSKLQPRVTASLTEAEYLGLSHACKETVYLTQLLGELGFPAEGAAVLYGDNQGANALSKDPQFHNRTRHLRLTEHFVREQVQDGSICVEYIPTARMLADAMTKSLPAPLFERHRDAVGPATDRHDSPGVAVAVPSRPTPLPTDSHLRSADNYDVWCIQLRGLIGPDAYKVMTGTLARGEGGISTLDWDRLNEFVVSTTVISCHSSVIHHVADCEHDAHAYWTALRDTFRPTDAQGALRLLTRFWSLSLPTASPEAFDTFAKDYKATLAALKTAKVDLETIYSSHLLNALPASLSSLQTSLAVANQSNLPRPDAILEVVRNEILRHALVAECDPKKRDEYRAKQSKQRKERAAARLATSTPPALPSSPAPTGPTAALAELLETDVAPPTACAATPACSPRSAHARLRPWGLSGKNGLKVTGVGSLSVKLTGGRVVKINRALLVPGITVNLVSTSQLYDLHGVTTTFGKDAILSRNGQVIATGSRLTSNLYRLNGALVDPSAAEGAYALLASGSATIELTTWHRRFAHLSLRSIDALARSKHVTGLKVDGSGRSKTSGSHICNVCHVARSSRLPFPRSDSIASTPLELVHSDVLSINVPSLGGRRYVVTFVDDHTRMLWVEPLARKSDVFEAFVRFKAKVENESGRRIQRFRSDNGGEYMSRTFDDMLAEHGIIRESPPPYSPQSNGVAERVNRSIVEGIVSLLAQAGAPKALWAEALQAFVFVKNRSPHAALSGNVPLAVWRNRPARVDMLRTWGCRAWHTVTNGRSKLDDRAIPLIFVGYDGDTAAYRLFDPVTRKTIRSRDTRFVEDEFPLLASRTAESSPAQAIEPADIVVTAARDDPPLGVPPAPVTPAAPPAVTPRAPARHGLEHVTPFTPAPPRPDFARASAPTPSTPDSPDPLDFLSDPFGATLAEVTALIAATSHELDAADDAFSFPTSDPRNHREAMRDLDVERWRAGEAEEFSSLRDEFKVFHTVERSDVPPDAKILGCRFVYRRKKDEHGRVTGHKVRLVAQGFSQRPGVDFRDTFAPVAKFTSIRVLLALAARKKMLIHQADVDKAYLHGSLDEELYMRIPEGIDSGEYSGKVLKLDRALYGLKQAGRIHQRSDGSLFLSQRAYLEDVLLRLDPNGRRTAPTPMVPNQQLVPAPDDHVPTPDFRRRYLQAVGSLMYAMLGTRVDLAHVVGYIRGTLDYGLEYTPDSSPLRGFEAYSDSDWGACPTTSRSTMGYVFLLANGAVSWSSKLQPRVTASLTEAEYLGLSHACKETVYLTQLLGELGFPAEGAAVLYGDNQGANALSKDPQFHNRTRHLRLTEHFVREQVQDGSICVEYIPTARMLADAMTKSLPAPLFERHRDAR